MVLRLVTPAGAGRCTEQPPAAAGDLVQVTVFTESLEEVLLPTFRSILDAVEHYKAKGGAARVLVCDDGLQVGARPTPW